MGGFGADPAAAAAVAFKACVCFFFVGVAVEAVADFLPFLLFFDPLPFLPPLAGNESVSLSLIHI